MADVTVQVPDQMTEAYRFAVVYEGYGPVEALHRAQDEAGVDASNWEEIRRRTEELRRWIDHVDLPRDDGTVIAPAEQIRERMLFLISWEGADLEKPPTDAAALADFRRKLAVVSWATSVLDEIGWPEPAREGVAA